MRILLCDTDNVFLQNINPIGPVDLIKTTVPGEALGAGVFNLVCISTDIQEWSFLAQHFMSQGAEIYIIDQNISDINIWKHASELGCKGVWAKDNVLDELNMKINGKVTGSGSVSHRPLRGQLSRSNNTANYNKHGAAPLLQKTPNYQRQQSAVYNPHAPAPPAIVVNRELICFYGADGGVGKTTVSINTGIRLVSQGKSVVVVDFDVFSGNVATRLKVAPVTTMIDWIKGNQDELSNYLIDHSSGLKILPAPLNHEEGELITEDISIKILSILTKRFDVVIVDTPPLLIAPTLITMENATRVYVLCPPDSASVANTKKNLRKLEMLNFEHFKFKLLVTKMPKSRPLEANNMSASLELELAGIIPYDEGVQVESNKGNPPVLSRRAKNFAKSINNLCDIIAPRPQMPRQRFSIFNIFKRREGVI